MYIAILGWMYISWYGVMHIEVMHCTYIFEDHVLKNTKFQHIKNMAKMKFSKNRNEIIQIIL